MRGREVVVTGMGVVSPIANELNLFWEGILAGRSGIARVESMEDIDQYPVQIAGEVRDLEVEKYVEAKEACDNFGHQHVWIIAIHANLSKRGKNWRIGRIFSKINALIGVSLQIK